ncbi:hypothetical protein C4D60_Mb11t10850 [Musa balbisiana]|uniref:Uncharacterized protein n=1 Tax=Musa balbisiana TaxID=52838 RepID=A0A4S8J367_MUSBA|nr:hypothetical protein C4D60_Mb11t10850 [Musa balbisiana]
MTRQVLLCINNCKKDKHLNGIRHKNKTVQKVLCLAKSQIRNTERKKKSTILDRDRESETDGVAVGDVGCGGSSGGGSGGTANPPRTAGVSSAFANITKRLGNWKKLRSRPVMAGEHCPPSFLSLPCSSFDCLRALGGANIEKSLKFGVIANSIKLNYHCYHYLPKYARQMTMSLGAVVIIVVVIDENDTGMSLETSRVQS